jgi:hypothetical protein
MDIHVSDQNEHVPQPRNNVRIEDLAVAPYPDRFRIFIELKITPFLERPNLLLVVHDDEDKIVGELSIIETMHAAMEFTMHLRTGRDPAGAYVLTAELFYENRNPPLDRRMGAFIIPEVDLSPGAE